MTKRDSQNLSAIAFIVRFLFWIFIVLPACWFIANFVVFGAAGN